MVWLDLLAKERRQERLLGLASSFGAETSDPLTPPFPNSVARRRKKTLRKKLLLMKKVIRRTPEKTWSLGMPGNCEGF